MSRDRSQVLGLLGAIETPTLLVQVRSSPHGLAQGVAQQRNSRADRFTPRLRRAPPPFPDVRNDPAIGAAARVRR